MTGPESSRLVPGSIVAERYRIVALLGSGGMGDVYRAQDLKLEQDVALKFLPERFGQSDLHLDRFVEEVRMARQVSHPNVCRVHDIGEVDGRQYISMEYVDGEDLASLLRRVGRLPQDRAIEIARQICAGVGAAHDQGMLHRDLKPANVMIDGDGDAKIADFGLAAIASSLSREDVLVGTPKYMAPEQLRGESVDRASDIFAFGLVLHEMITGQPVYDEKSVQDLRDAHERTDPNPSTYLPTIEPTLEAVIQRCLARDPAQRPKSMQEIAAGLPGGDPIAAALAAGETPSPQLIAAAGGSGTLPRNIALLLLACIVVGYAFVGYAHRHMKLVEVVRPELSLGALEQRAKEIAESLGVAPDPSRPSRGTPDSEFGFTQRIHNGLSRAVDRGRGDELLRHPLAESLRFWYRTSYYTMVPEGSHGRVSFNRPPLDGAGMMRLVLGHDGALQWLESVPIKRDDEGEPFDWSKAFAAARLDMSQFEERQGYFLPDQPFDERKIWTGRDPDVEELQIIVSGASFGSRLVLFAVEARFDIEQEPFPDTATVRGVFEWSSILVSIFAVVGGVWLGWRNLTQRRGDSRNATRIAVYIFVLVMVRWVTQASHVGDFQREWLMFTEAAGSGLWSALVAWFLYMALEPTLRRMWPHRLVSWNRLIGGRLRDPSVGRDVLIGVAGSAVWLTAVCANWLTARAFGDSGASPHFVDTDALRGPVVVLGEMAFEQSTAGFIALLAMFLYVLAKSLLRRAVLALGVLFVLAMCSVPYTIMGEFLLLEMAFRIVQTISILTVLMTGGLVGVFAAMFLVKIVSDTSVTFDFTTWWSGGGMAVAVVVGVLAVYGYTTSVRPVRAPGA